MNGPVKLTKADSGLTKLELKVADSFVSSSLAVDFVYALSFHTEPNQTNEELNQKH